MADKGNGVAMNTNCLQSVGHLQYLCHCLVTVISSSAGISITSVILFLGSLRMAWISGKKRSTGSLYVHRHDTVLRCILSVSSGCQEVSQDPVLCLLCLGCEPFLKVLMSKSYLSLLYSSPQSILLCWSWPLSGQVCQPLGASLRSLSFFLLG